jgi:catechol 2,3-dioxygenase-like lactoylglutathione lyase family enzyme
LPESLDFYSELFGFSTVEEGSSKDPYPWAIVRSGSAMLCLYQHPKLEISPRFPEPPSNQEVRHFAFRIQDGARFERLCEQQGVPLLFGGPVRWPHSTSYYIQDPSGHQIEVVHWDNDEIAFS